MNLDDPRKTVLITGATGALGRILALGFAAAGAALILHGRDQVRLEKLVAEITSLPETGPVRLWLSELADLDAFRRACLDIGPVDILINNAAVQGPIGPLEDNDMTAWMSVFNINLFASVVLAQACLPNMKKRHFGRIINISGGGAAGPRPFFSAYSAAKAALVRFTETLAHELVDTGITVNAVAPGPMFSSMTQAVLAAGEQAGTKELEAARKYMQQQGGGGGALSYTSGLPQTSVVVLPDALSALSGIDGKNGPVTKVNLRIQTFIPCAVSLDASGTRLGAINEDRYYRLRFYWQKTRSCSQRNEA